MSAQSFEAAAAVLRQGLAGRAFPAAVACVGDRNGVRWIEPFGRLSYDDTAPACATDTIFDLASLTKVIATASVAMANVGARRITLETAVSAVMPGFEPDPWREVTVRHLLDHSSGLPARVPGWQQTAGRDGFAALISRTGLERRPGAAAVYSDVGSMLLGLVLEAAGGATLDRQFSALFGRRLDPLGFRPLAELYERIAPTEFDPWRGRVLCGEVHDENAAALGGVAGHAGLFGTAESVGRFAQIVLETFERPTILGSPELMRRFAARSTVPGSSRALGWDTARPTSSSGTRMPATAIGHTGFTGTSLWIDWETGFYAVLLTNRVHPTRANESFLPLRAAFHDALPR